MLLLSSLWDSSVNSRINGTVTNMVRVMLGMRYRDGDHWVQGHVRTMIAAKLFVQTT